MIQATLLNKEPTFKSKKSKSENVSINTNEYKRCKGLFNINSINMALDSLNLKYKMLDEVDIYNIIEHILATNRKN